MVQAEYLEWQYSPSKWNKRMPPDDVVQHFLQKTSEVSKEAIKSLKGQFHIPYGEKKAQVDIFKPDECAMETDEGKGPPVLLFIHGGYWQDCSKDEYSHVAVPITRAGGIAVIVGYNLAPAVTMDDIVLEIKCAVEFVAKQFPKSCLLLCGYSAGAHLCAMMMTLHWADEEIPNRVKGMCLISGIFDLLPIVNTYINDALNMTEDCAARNSPQKILQCRTPTLPSCRVVRAAVGEHESPEFHKQTQEFIETLKKHGIECSLTSIAGEDHFSLMENLAQPEFPLAKLLCELMFAAMKEERV